MNAYPDYNLLDSGHGQKLERFGKYTLIRPCSVAVWHPKLPEKTWENAHARFSREFSALSQFHAPQLRDIDAVKPSRKFPKDKKIIEEKDLRSGWEHYKSLPEEWEITIENIRFKIRPTEFGHLGFFPEHVKLWKWLQEQIKPKHQILNLFAYSGGATLFAAKAGAEATHVDAAKGMVSWARENGALNQLEARWIVEDVSKYLSRCYKRGHQFEGIILDPPTFGRGKSNEVFKIEEDLPKILDQCALLKPRYMVLSCHTPGYTDTVLRQLLKERFSNVEFCGGELLLEGPDNIPSGNYASWTL